MRLIVTLAVLGLSLNCRAQSVPLVDAPTPQANVLAVSPNTEVASLAASSTNLSGSSDPISAPDVLEPSETTQNSNRKDPNSQSHSDVPVDANGVPVPLERQQPKRILGFMPNFRSVSGGAKPHPPGWKYNFTVATHQATDYSTFIFLGITSLIAEGTDTHPVLGKGVAGYWAYTWRGFLDKSDGTYLSAWFLPSLLHEDTRNFAMGNGHSIPIRILYVISRQGVARTYGGRQTPNIAGLGGKVLTQVVSRTYYPPGATSFGVLATKFGYSSMRDVMFTSIREFYPDIAAHFIRKHREKMARINARAEAAVY